MALGRAAFAFGIALLPLASSAGDETSLVELGRQLFEENWLRPPADDSPLAGTRRGDGLGPLFNGASCAECHRLGGVGGAGPNENNVEIVSLALPLDARPPTILAAMRSARKMHPDFLRDSNVFLHRFGLDEQGAFDTYDGFRGRIRSLFPAEVVPARQTQVTLPDGLPYQFAQRNTPALWGAGLIDKIEPRLVAETSQRQRRQFPDLAGVATDGGAGRYGWRGQMATLEQFVRMACAEELGMRVKGLGIAVHDQPPWPVDGGERVANSRPPVDLSEDQVKALLTFVRSLPAPRQIMPDDPHAAATADEGRGIFHSIGCAVCHVQDMGPVTGIYSDMLLHDMGVNFADRVAAPLAEVTPRVRSTDGGTGVARVPVGYSGTRLTLIQRTKIDVIPPSLGDLTRATQAFRTPALWGVSDSAPYLHDGRAETLDDAIRQHAGQAEPVADRYAQLPTEDRSKLLAFLETLKAPSLD